MLRSLQQQLKVNIITTDVIKSVAVRRQDISRLASQSNAIVALN
jgi:hypothetical protein